MKKPAKMLWSLGLLSVLAIGAAKPAQAYDGPWCAVYSLGFGAVSEKCDMPTFETCLHEARIFGSTAFCRQNSYYAPYWGVREPQRHVRVKKHRQVER